MLTINGMVSLQEVDGPRAVLNAATLTYVAALLQSVGQLLCFIFFALGMGRSGDE